ncbi:MAG: glutamate-5-semialdehyde dehydrogenase [Pyramidobacter sp.]|nr:glutamate-5-semialdehyde dehydrogenase [Pyramidobacter sp.]
MDVSLVLDEMGRKARAAAREMALAGSAVKNAALLGMARNLRARQKEILDANARDMKEGAEAGLTAALLERLTLNEARIEGMARGCEEIAALPDPIGRGISRHVSAEGLEIEQVRVPLGVIGMIYESRPNVTADAAALCLKSGNAVILRGGHEASNSNRAIANALVAAIFEAGLPESVVQLLDVPGRDATLALMALEDLDVLIPRGGKRLKQAVREHAKVPYIMTGMGLCHLYIDESADAEMCVPVAVNAKTQRPSVCNAIETLLVHEKAAPRVLPAVAAALAAHGVELRGDAKAREIFSMNEATDEDWATEYLDLILSVKVVASLDEALAHIARYGTGHSESILTSDYAAAEKFLNSVDAAAVYVNASTRFTDGGVFGLGAEMGISTQKLHARGPMGIEQLTGTKFRIRGNGQVRR